MKVHPLFPTTICEFNYPKSESFKKNLSKSIFKYLNEDGFSNEITGHVTLHHEPEYHDLYCFLQKCVREYLQILSVEDNNFNINFIKSWFNIQKNKTSPEHAHADAHISIVYYANVPDNCTQAIRFNNALNRLEPFSGCIRWNNTKDIWNVYNSSSWKFYPKEGDVFVFPSKLAHDTVSDQINSLEDTGIKTNKDFNEHRICIASDVLLCYKDKQALPLGIQPIENWRSFK